MRTIVSPNRLTLYFAHGHPRAAEIGYTAQNIDKRHPAQMRIQHAEFVGEDSSAQGRIADKPLAVAHGFAAEKYFRGVGHRQGRRPKLGVPVMEGNRHAARSD